MEVGHDNIIDVSIPVAEVWTSIPKVFEYLVELGDLNLLQILDAQYSWEKGFAQTGI